MIGALAILLVSSAYAYNDYVCCPSDFNEDSEVMPVIGYGFFQFLRSRVANDHPLQKLLNQSEMKDLFDWRDNNIGINPPRDCTAIGPLSGSEIMKIAQKIDPTLGEASCGPDGVTECKKLDIDHKVYHQLNDIIATEDCCIDITGYNITFIGDGFSIRNKTLNVSGICVKNSDAKIYDVNVSMGAGYALMTKGIGINIFPLGDAVVDNSTLDGQYYGAYLQGAGSVVKNTNIRGNVQYSIAVAGNKNLLHNLNITESNIGAFFYETELNNLTGSIVQSNGKHGILSERSSSLMLGDNIISDNEVGIFLNMTNTSTVLSNQIKDNNRGTVTSSGLVMHWSFSNQIKGNEISGHASALGRGDGILSLNGMDNFFVENTVYDNYLFGIRADNGSYFYNNSVHHNSDGIFVLHQNTLISNTVTHNYGAGIYVDDDCVVINNSADHNRFGIRVSHRSYYLDNNAYFNQVGFLAEGTRSATMINNTACSNNIGFALDRFFDSTINGSISCENNKTGIYLNGNENALYFNDFYNNSHKNVGASISVDGDANYMKGGTFNISGHYHIYVSGRDNFFSDLEIMDADVYDVNISSPLSPAMNNTFLNVTYNMTKEHVSPGSQLIRKWYYQAYVQDENGIPQNGVVVTGHNVSNDLHFTMMTSAGLTEKGTITDYYNEEGVRFFHSNFTTRASTIPDPHALNVTLLTNIFDIFTPQTSCGNGQLDAGEECDDGNQDDNDFCSFPQCRRKSLLCREGVVGIIWTICGDGHCEPGEIITCPGDCP